MVRAYMWGICNKSGRTSATPNLTTAHAYHLSLNAHGRTQTEGCPNKQKGSGHNYRDFVTAEMRQNGGNTKMAVAKYHEQEGGHMVRADDTKHKTVCPVSVDR